MAYPQTLTDLQNDVLSRLNEASLSTAPEFASGTGTATIAPLATITQYLNEASADLARGGFPIVETGTWASLPIGTNFVGLASTSFATASGYTLWAARSVSWNGTVLTHCSRSSLENWFPTWETDASGTPLYWYEQGEDGIGLYPTPSTAQNLVVAGLAVPKQLASGSDTPSWFHPDQVKLIVFQAAGRVAIKNAEDPSLAQRAQVWLGEFESGRQALLARLWQTDPQLASAHFPKVSGTLS